ncbi:MAG: hypothetical protein ACFFC7_12810 [Candidatus Hermodarchaeota archaeon]
MNKKLILIFCLGTILLLLLNPVTIVSAGAPQLGDTGHFEGEMAMIMKMVMSMLMYMDSEKTSLGMAMIMNQTMIMKMGTAQDWNVTDVRTDEFTVNATMAMTENATGSLMYQENAFGFYNGSTEQFMWENQTQILTPTPRTETSYEQIDLVWNESYIPKTEGMFGIEDEEPNGGGPSPEETIFISIGGDIIFPLGDAVTLTIELVWAQSQDIITQNINGADLILTANHWQGTNTSTIPFNLTAMFNDDGGDKTKQDEEGGGPPAELLELLSNAELVINASYNYYWDSASSWLVRLDNKMSGIIDEEFDGEITIPVSETENQTVWLEANAYVELAMIAELNFTEHSVITGQFFITPNFLVTGVVGVGLLSIIRRCKKKQN